MSAVGPGDRRAGANHADRAHSVGLAGRRRKLQRRDDFRGRVRRDFPPTVFGVGGRGDIVHQRSFTVGGTGFATSGGTGFASVLWRCARRVPARISPGCIIPPRRQIGKPNAPVTRPSGRAKHWQSQCHPPRGRFTNRLYAVGISTCAKASGIWGTNASTRGWRSRSAGLQEASRTTGIGKCGADSVQSRTRRQRMRQTPPKGPTPKVPRRRQAARRDPGRDTKSLEELSLPFLSIGNACQSSHP